METSYARLYVTLGPAAREYYSPTYRRLRWQCGCIASGLTPQRMRWQPCIHHRRAAALEYKSRR
jgi:hypothetical protein